MKSLGRGLGAGLGLLGCGLPGAGLLGLRGGVLGENRGHDGESDRHAEHQSHQFFHCAVLLGG